MTPSMIACSHSSEETAMNIIKMLENNGAHFNTSDNNGRFFERK